MMTTFSMANLLLPIPEVVDEHAASQIVRRGEVGAPAIHLGQFVDKVYERGLLCQHERRDYDLIPPARGCLLERLPDALGIEPERVLVETALLVNRRRLP